MKTAYWAKSSKKVSQLKQMARQWQDLYAPLMSSKSKGHTECFSKLLVLSQCIKCTMSNLHSCLSYALISQSWKKNHNTYKCKSQIQKDCLMWFLKSNWNLPRYVLTRANINSKKYKIMFLIFAWFYPVSLKLGPAKTFCF